MTRFQRSATSALALSLCLGGGPALADLTPQEVWQNWQSYTAGFGYSLQGTETTDGNTLTIRDLNVSMTLPENAGSVVMTIAEFNFTDNGDGTVTMTIPEVLPIGMRVDSPDAEDVDMTFNYLTKAFSMLAAGQKDALSYTYSADELSVVLKELVVEGEPVDIGTAVMTMASMTGRSDVKTGNLRNIAQNLSTGPITYALDMADPEGEGRIVLDGGLNAMTFTGQGDYPIGMSTSDMGAMLEAGFGFDGKFTHEGGRLDFNFTDAGETAQVKTSSDSGAFSVAMDAGKLLYAVSANNVNMDVVGGELPFPVQIAMAQSGFKLLMPVSEGEAEQDFALGLTLGDLTISDMLWGLFDPSAQLPRDPATLVLDLAGKARLFVDFLDPEAMADVSGDAAPGELNALSINELTLRAAGAELTGTGAFTFDNTDLETFDGMPAADGSVDLKLTGANALLDKLVSVGLLPEDQAMGARMMMGLFAVPGEGEDILTSKIEVQPNGQIMANGQRLK